MGETSVEGRKASGLAFWGKGYGVINGRVGEIGTAEGNDGEIEGDGG